MLVDMDPESFAVRPEDLEKRLTTKTAGVIVVHIGGIVSRRLPELQQWVAKKGLWLVEDAAHAHGSSYKGVRAGAFGIAGSFSFQNGKLMTAGEGGAYANAVPSATPNGEASPVVIRVDFGP